MIYSMTPAAYQLSYVNLFIHILNDINPNPLDNHIQADQVQTVLFTLNAI